MRYYSALIASFALFLASYAMAASDYKLVKNCGTAKVISGEDCDHLKIELDLNECASDAKIQTPKVTCSGDKAMARFSVKQFRYEAHFSKRADGWGKSDWQLDSPVGEYRRIKTAEVTPVPLDKKTAAAPVQVTSTNPSSEISREPAKVPTLDTTPASGPTASPFKLSGFFDFRYSNYSTNGNPTNLYPHAQSGFGLEDGAFYATYEHEKISVIMDLAFRRGKDSDTNPNATVGNQSSNSNLAIGVDKSQLYVRYKMSDALVFDAGQFDTIFGVEVNDSKDRFFGKTGLVYDTMLPLTHTGTMVEYSRSGAYIKALAANPNNKGSFGTSSTGDDNTEYGGAVGFANDLIRFQLGYMSRPINNAASTGRGDRTLADSTAGFTLGKFSFDSEYAMIVDPSKNTLTPGDNTDRESPGTGALAIATYKLDDFWSVGARYEDLENDPGSLGIKSANDATIGAHYRVSRELELRTEFGNYNFENVAGAKWNETRFNIASLISF